MSKITRFQEALRDFLVEEDAPPSAVAKALLEAAAQAAAQSGWYTRDKFAASAKRALARARRQEVDPLDTTTQAIRWALSDCEGPDQVSAAVTIGADVAWRLGLSRERFLEAVQIASKAVWLKTKASA